MKAKIRKTGEIVDVTRNKCGFYVDENSVGYTLDELDFGNEENEHWQDVREQAAIAAMQGLLANQRLYGNAEEYTSRSIEMADALVKQLKGE